MNATKARKPKSPPTPSRTLKEAFDDVKKAYDRYTHSTFSRSELASALNVSATSGPTNRRFFTLKEFGLIEGTGDNLKVSKLFMDMNGNAQDTAEFKRRALEAIKNSDVFSELLGEWGTKLPPRDAVATRLEHQKKFNPENAKEAAGVLEESLRYAGVLDSNNNILPVRDTSPESNNNLSAADLTAREEEHEPEVTGGAAALRTEIPLGEGRRVVVSYPNDLTSDEAKKVGNVLQAIVG